VDIVINGSSGLVWVKVTHLQQLGSLVIVHKHIIRDFPFDFDLPKQRFGEAARATPLDGRTGMVENTADSTFTPFGELI
jgi:hypothetical protein